MNITIRNDFHNTEVQVRVPHLPHELSAGQAARVRKALCPAKDCRCGVIRGTQRAPSGQPMSCEATQMHDGQPTWVVDHAYD